MPEQKYYVQKYYVLTSQNALRNMLVGLNSYHYFEKAPDGNYLFTEEQARIALQSFKPFKPILIPAGSLEEIVRQV